ncbi:ribonuclease H-like domain-containing protein [Tanacetum coccineum]
MFQGGLPLNMWTESILTAIYLINRLPTVVLSRKSPFELVYKCAPNFSHLKTFGCLCFATVLNNSDKFSSRSEKCVFIDYAFDKKGYKLFSLDKTVFYSRDVNFYETVFPVKNKSTKDEFVFESDNVNNLNFNDEIFYEKMPKSKDPNDDVGNLKGDSSAKSSANPKSASKQVGSDKFVQADKVDRVEPIFVDVSTSEGSGNNGSKFDTIATLGSTDETNIDENIKNTDLNDNGSESEGEGFQKFGSVFKSPKVGAQTSSIGESSGLIVYARKSGRKTKLPSKLSDYFLDKNVKYGIERHVDCSNLNIDNYVFTTNLNKIHEPKTYEEACKDRRWIDVMNLEMEALNRNGTWTITDLPNGRKAIRSK